MINKNDIGQLIAIMELPTSCINFLNLPYERAVKKVQEFKKLIKKQRRLLAKKYHPDKGGDIEKMKEINDIADWLLTIKLMRPQPQPIAIRIIVNSTGTNTATTTGTW